MLCSISSTGKSRSKWLDKLRSSKGFPSGADLDLEQFLNHNNQNSSSSSNTEQESSTSTPDPIPSPIDDPVLHHNQPFEAQTSDGDTEIFSLMSNVLAELFVMGKTSNNLPKCKKSSRKQTNPKFCASNLDCPEINNNESGSPISDDNGGVGMKKDRRSSDEQLKLVGDEEEEKEKGCMNLSGFSRTEVTVIDTSFATWKFEKMLFRKKNVWKVRDKKGKTMSLGNKKKRKGSGNLDDQNSEDKKQKVLHGQCSLSKKGCGEALNEDGHQPNKSDMYDKISKKSQETSLLRNAEKESSSVILIKSIPISNKIGAILPRKSDQRQSKG